MQYQYKPFQWSNNSNALQPETDSYVSYAISFNRVLRLMYCVSGSSVVALEYMVVTNIELNRCRCWGVQLSSTGGYTQIPVIPWLFIIGY